MWNAFWQEKFDKKLSNILSDPILFNKVAFALDKHGESLYQQPYRNKQ